MGSKEKCIRSFHFHRSHGGKNRDLRDVPKGCLAIRVGQGEEELQRFVVPVVYINHPLFSELLKEAEEEYGFHHKGPITLPCQVEEFRYVRRVIDQENSLHYHQHHHHHRIGCFGF